MYLYFEVVVFYVRYGFYVFYENDWKVVWNVFFWFFNIKKIGYLLILWGGWLGYFYMFEIYICDWKYF